jgi:hypothetical protein
MPWARIGKGRPSRTLHRRRSARAAHQREDRHVPRSQRRRAGAATNVIDPGDDIRSLIAVDRAPIEDAAVDIAKRAPLARREVPIGAGLDYPVVRWATTIGCSPALVASKQQHSTRTLPHRNRGAAQHLGAGFSVGRRGSVSRSGARRLSITLGLPPVRNRSLLRSSLLLGLLLNRHYSAAASGRRSSPLIGRPGLLQVVRPAVPSRTKAASALT